MSKLTEQVFTLHAHEERKGQRTDKVVLIHFLLCRFKLGRPRTRTARSLSLVHTIVSPSLVLSLHIHPPPAETHDADLTVLFTIDHKLLAKLHAPKTADAIFVIESEEAVCSSFHASCSMYKELTAFAFFLCQLGAVWLGINHVLMVSRSSWQADPLSGV